MTESDQSTKLDSLLRLFQSEYFDAHLHLFYLNKTAQSSPGAHDYLVNLLYRNLSESDFDFYLPQLLLLALAHIEVSDLSQFLLDRAGSNSAVALRLHWLCAAASETLPTSDLRDEALRLWQETEMMVVNSKWVSRSLQKLSQSGASLPAEPGTVPSREGLGRTTSDPDVLTALRSSDNVHVSGRRVSTSSSETSPRSSLPATPKVGGRVAAEGVAAPAVLGGREEVRNTLEILRGLSRATLALGAATFLSECSFSIYAELREPFGPWPNTHLSRAVLDDSFDCLFALKQLRCDHFNLINALVDLLTRTCSELVNHVDRRGCLATVLCQLNQWLFERRCAVALSGGVFVYSGAMLPLNVADHPSVFENLAILRFHVEECRAFKTKTRAPFLVTFECADLDEEADHVHGLVLSEIQRANKAVSVVAPIDGVVVSGVAPVDGVVVSGVAPVVGISRRSQLRKAVAKGTPDAWVELFYRPLVTGPVPTVMGVLIKEAEADGEVSSGSEKKGRRAMEQARATRRRIWGAPFEEKTEKIRKASVYGHLKSWRLKPMIIKGGDDVRQEVLAQQLIRSLKKIFDEVSLPLWLRPYEVAVTGGDSGLMEFVENTVSVDALKKEFAVNTSLATIFEEVFADSLNKAKMNFVESLAGYSIVCFLLQVKDRHNANLLIDSAGHMIHIDFGFMLANAPGNLNFETSPFKLTQEYLDIMGGEDSELFESYQTLLIRGFLEVRKHSERLLLLVQLMGACGGALPCFAGNVDATVAAMKERLYLNITDEACMEKIVELIDSSINNWRTNTYDSFQRLTNGIL